MTKKKTPSKKLTVKKETVERLVVDESGLRAGRAAASEGPAHGTCNYKCDPTQLYSDCKCND
jgi:hypothetical protein